MLSKVCGGKSLRYSCVLWMALMFVAASLAGCGSSLPTEAELALFRTAGPTLPGGVELNNFLRAKVPTGAYRVVPGDLLGVDMPGVMAAIDAPEAESDEPISRRVRADGTLRLPGLDEDVPVKGMTIPEIEVVLEQAYAQRVLRRPSVVAGVMRYKTVTVAVRGDGVVDPGVYKLRSNELSLAALLMKANGVVGVGAKSVTVWPADSDDPASALVLPVRNGSILLADVALTGGERVDVVALGPPMMTVVGQVGQPGLHLVNRSRPTILIEALGKAGGVREVEDPRYVSVYRRDSDGNVVSARFKLNGNSLTRKSSLFHDNALGDGAFATIKPGDVVVVERTVRSRMRQFLARAFRVSIGVSGSVGGTYFEDFQDSGSNRDNRD